MRLSLAVDVVQISRDMGPKLLCLLYCELVLTIVVYAMHLSRKSPMDTMEICRCDQHRSFFIFYVPTIQGSCLPNFLNPGYHNDCSNKDQCQRKGCTWSYVRTSKQSCEGQQTRHLRGSQEQHPRYDFQAALSADCCGVWHAHTCARGPTTSRMCKDGSSSRLNFLCHCLTALDLCRLAFPFGDCALLCG